jgi:hypothetical protein
MAVGDKFTLELARDSSSHLVLGFDVRGCMKQYVQEEGIKSNQGDKEVCKEGIGDKRCESGREVEQADLE